MDQDDLFFEHAQEGFQHEKYGNKRQILAANGASPNDQRHRSQHKCECFQIFERANAVKANNRA
jgi:hypothetical protein